MAQEIFVKHTLEPVYDENSKTLILGSFPSVKSRENRFYYGHPQNRFWKVIAYVCEEETPSTIEEKKELLLSNNIALWDVVYSCNITGSKDSSIRNIVPVDIIRIMENASITSVFTNGGLSAKLYKRYLEKLTGIEALGLPSTSPANAAYSLEQLKDIWKHKMTN